MNIIYRIVHFFFKLLSRLPFKALYVLSDIIYPLVYYVVGYRKRLVRKHLETSFPEKSKDELRDIERGFYHFLCDYFMETIKLLTITREELLRRVEYRGVEDIEKCFDEGQSCALILGHYCNWEYLIKVGLAFQRHPDAIIGVIYHPLKSEVFDRLFIELREHLCGICVPKNETLRYLVNYRREGKLSLFGYVSDQTPKWNNIHLWLPFLGHDTPVFTNGEKLMKKMNNAIFYVDFYRPRRGYYIIDLQLLTRTPNELEEHAVTKLFFKRLEESIRREPKYYLWTHNRWKRTHEEFDRRFKVVNGKVIPREKNT
jgi:KDO2-lipid IV(A) lauroyltransferase